MSEFRFKLLGHDNPLGRYPAPVVPIGRLDEELVAIFAGAENVQKIAEGDLYIRHNEELTHKLRDFNYTTDRLFAFDERDVDAYHVIEELDYFKQLLSNPSFSKSNPFLRLSLAKVIAAPQVLSEELYNCVTSLSFSADDEFIDNWYKREREKLLSKVDARDRWALPITWRVLLRIQQARKPIVARPRGGFFSNTSSQSIGGGVGAAMGAARVAVAMFNTRTSLEFAYQLLLERNYDYRDVSLLLLQRTFEVLFPEFQVGLPAPGIDETSLSKLFLNSEYVDLGGSRVVCAGPYAKSFGGVVATGSTANLMEGLTAAGLSEPQARLFEEGIKHGGILMGVSSIAEGDAWYFENEWIKT